MGISELLQEFGEKEAPEEELVVAPDPALEEARQQGYEEGHKAGWDEAESAAAAENKRISAEFARNLEDLSFTYHEALNHFAQATAPLLQALVERVLPKMMRETLGLHVIEQLSDMARAHANGTIECLVTPENAPLIRTFLAQEHSLSVEVIEDAALDEGQVFLRFGDAEREINFDAILEATTNACAALQFQIKKESKHGRV